MAASTIRALASQIESMASSLPDDRDVEEQTSKVLIHTAKELITAMQTPIDHASSLLSGMAQPAVIRTLMQFGVFEAIPAAPKYVTAEELAEKTGAQSSLLTRMLRVLVGTGFIQQIVKDDGRFGFAHTTVSQAFCAGFFSKVFGALYDELMVMMALLEYFKSHVAREPDGEESKMSNPQTWRRGCEGRMTAFEAMESDPDHTRNFQIIMSMVDVLRPWTGVYNFEKLAEGAGDRPVFVDVGGGDGTMISKLLDAHPQIMPEQCILQDREAIIKLAKNARRTTHSLQESSVRLTTSSRRSQSMEQRLTISTRSHAIGAIV